MRQLSLGVFHAADSYQQTREPRMVRVGHWDIIRQNPAKPVFGLAEDELLARLIGLAQEYQEWVCVEREGFRHHINRDVFLRNPVSILTELRERHQAGDMADPDLSRFPVHTALLPGQGGMSLLLDGFRRLVETTDVVQVHRPHSRALAISLHPRALRRILELQR
ncbi:MAG: hypothetical protein AAB558_02215 [Patescibacteria group bacterium]